MELTERLRVTDVRLFVGEDMTEEASVAAGPGVAVVYSSPRPGKQTPNEDAAAILPVSGRDCVLAVADGLGGARAGDRASSLAVEALRAALERGVGQGRDVRDIILNGFEHANGAVLELGMGAATTLAVVEVRHQIVRPYHVGDSLILVVGQRGRVKLQSVPHSPVGYGVESGLLDEVEAMYHAERHIVSNVVGMTNMRIDVGPALEMSERDTVLIASDGLWDNLHLEEIVEIIRKGPLPKAAKTLVRMCNERMRNGTEDGPSKPDDLTFVLFRLGPPKRKRG